MIPAAITITAAGVPAWMSCAETNWADPAKITVDMAWAVGGCASTQRQHAVYHPKGNYPYRIGSSAYPTENSLRADGGSMCSQYDPMIFPQSQNFHLSYTLFKIAKCLL